MTAQEMTDSQYSDNQGTLAEGREVARIVQQEAARLVGVLEVERMPGPAAAEHSHRRSVQGA